MKPRHQFASCVLATIVGLSLASQTSAQSVSLWLGEKIASKLFDKGWNLVTGEPDPAEIAKNLKELEAEFRGKDSIYEFEIARLRQDQARFVNRDEVKRLVDLAIKDMENRMTSLEQRQVKVSELLAKIEKPLGVIPNIPPAPPKVGLENGAGAPGSSRLMPEYASILVQSHLALETTKSLLAEGFPETSAKVRASIQAEKDVAGQADALLAKTTSELQAKAAKLADLQKEFPASDPRIKEDQTELSHLRWLASMLSPGYRDARGTLLLPLEFLRSECSDLLASFINSGVKTETLLPLIRDLLSYPLELKPEPLEEPTDLVAHRTNANSLLASGSRTQGKVRRLLTRLDASLKSGTEEDQAVQKLRMEETCLLADLKKLHDHAAIALDGALMSWITILKTKRQNAAPLLKFRMDVLQPLYRLTLATQPTLAGNTGELRNFLAMDPPLSLAKMTAVKAESIVLPKVDFREATIDEAVEFLRHKARDLDPEKIGINIILNAPEAREQRVTVALSNVPLSEALRYVTGLCNLKLSVEDFAIVIEPIHSAARALGQGLGDGVGSSTTKAKMVAATAEALTLPEIRFSDATITEVVEYLGIRARQLDPEQQGVNISLKANERDASARVVLEMKNVPITEALRYCAMVCNMEMRIGEFGIVIQSKPQ